MPPRVTLSEEQIHLIAKALADPRRVEILKQIGAKTRPVACTEIREAQPVTAATLSHHLGELESAGLVVAIRKGKFVDLELRRNVLRAYTRHLAGI